MTAQQLAYSFHTNDPAWPQNLEGKFNIVIIDEAQAIKNPMSHNHLAVIWLDATFYILVTGTPDANELVRDMEGYLLFIEPSKKRCPKLFTTT